MAFKTATVNAASVAAPLTDFPAYVDLSRLGITTLAEAESVRVYADEAKATELAREIVSATEMHVKIPSLTTTTAIYVDWDGVRADYSPTDTYGRNAVWSDYYAVWHFQGSPSSPAKREDSTGNSRSITEGGSPASADGLYGSPDGAYDLRGYNSSRSNSSGADWLERPTGVLSDYGSGSFTMQGWFNPDYANTGIGWFLISIEANSAAGRPYARIQRSTSNQSVSGVRKTSSGANDAPAISGAYSNDTWNMFAFGLNNSLNPFQFVNGILTTAASSETGSFVLANAPFYINRRYNTSYSSSQAYGDGQYDEVRVRLSHLNEDWLATEYNNQNDESTFWGTWTDAGGDPTPTPTGGFFNLMRL